MPLGKAKAFLEKMGRNGGKQEGGKVVEIWHATALQPKSGERKGASLTNSHVTPSSPNCMLSRLNQAERVATNGRSTNSETVYSRNVSRRVRFLLESVPSPQEVRGLETSNRSVKVKRVLNTSNFPDGHGLRALLKLSVRILRLAHRLKIVMVPRHIAGQLNVHADLASRTGQVIPSEWSLVTESFYG